MATLIRTLIFVGLVLFNAIASATAVPVIDSVILRTMYKAGTPAAIAVNGRTIATLRSHVFANDPTMRARMAEERIAQLLEGSYNGVVTTRSYGDGKAIDVDGKPLIFLSPADPDMERGETLNELTATTVNNLQQTLQEARELSDPTMLLTAIGLALLYFVLWFVGSRLLFVLKRRMMRVIAARIAKTSEQSKIGGIMKVGASHGLLTFAERLNVALVWLGVLILTYSWITLTLEAFPVTRAWGESMAHTLGDAGLWVLMGLVNALPGLVTIVVIVVVTRLLIRVLHWIMGRVERGELELPWIDPSTIAPTKRIVSIVLWIFALAVAYPFLPGSSSEAFKGVSVLVGLMISFGTTGVVGQAASGFILMYSRIISVGEFVRIGDHQGTVQQIGFFNTTLSTPFHELITIPNTVLLSSTIVNSTRIAGGGLTVSTQVTIGYDVPWRLVHEMLAEAAQRTDNISSDPEPFVSQTALDDYYVSYKLTVNLIDKTKRRITLTTLHGNIQDVFHENGRQIMSPHYVMDPDDPKIVDPAVKNIPMRKPQ